MLRVEQLEARRLLAVGAADEYIYRVHDDDNQPLALNVLANDEGRELQIVEVSSPNREGEVAIVENGRLLKYQPQEGFTGVEKFEYVILGVDGRSSAAVEIHVTDSAAVTGIVMAGAAAGWDDAIVPVWRYVKNALARDPVKDDDEEDDHEPSELADAPPADAPSADAPPATPPAQRAQGARLGTGGSHLRGDLAGGARVDAPARAGASRHRCARSRRSSRRAKEWRGDPGRV